MSFGLRSLVPPIISLSGIFAAVGILLALRWMSRRRWKRSPLTRDLLRSPGQWLRQEVDDLTLALVSDFATLAVVSSFAGLLFSMVDRPGTTLWMYGAAIASPMGAFLFFANSLAATSMDP